MSLPKTVCSVWQTVVVRASIILFFGTFRTGASRRGSMEGNTHKTRWANLSLLPALTIAVAEPKRSRQFSVWPGEPEAGEGIPLSERGLVAPGLDACAMAELGLAQSSEATCGAELRSGALVALLTDYALEPVEVHALFPAGPPPSTKVRAFAYHLAAALSGASFL
jgi:DNA-binding transcriptional LysR family regulator